MVTSLEKLLREIEDISRKEQDEVLLEARAEAENIKAQGSKEADDCRANIIEKANISAKMISERAAAQRRIEYRNEILLLKQSLVDSAIDDAKNSIGRLNDEEYFNLLKLWASRLDISGSVTVHLNKKDLKRDMGGFLDRFPKPVETVELSNTPADISGGFLVDCGGVTINCSINAIFDAYSDDIRNNVQQILFG